MASKKRFTVQTDTSGWAGAVNKLTNETLPQAVRDAMGRSYVRIKSQLAKTVGSQLKVSQKHIRNRTRLIRSRGKPFEGTVEVERMSISAYALNARQTRFGVVARGSHKWRPAFIANPGPKNNLKKPTAFSRVGPRMALQGGERKPWYVPNEKTKFQRLEWSGVPVAEPVKREIQPVISRIMRDDFGKILEQRVRYWSKKPVHAKWRGSAKIARRLLSD